MSGPTIHGKRRALSASSILKAVADDLSQIKHEDGLTWSDMGRVLGKSEDQAAKYADGSAEMGIVAFTLARDQWNGRFTGRLDAMINCASDGTCDRVKQSALLKANLALSVALEDGEITVAEIHANRAILEDAKAKIEELLSRIGSEDAAT